MTGCPASSQSCACGEPPALGRERDWCATREDRTARRHSALLTATAVLELEGRRVAAVEAAGPASSTNDNDDAALGRN